MNKNKAVLEVKFKGLGLTMAVIAAMGWLAGAWSGYMAGKDNAEERKENE